jgi:hypothetical protein
MEQLSRRFGPKPLAWLLKAINTRITLAEAAKQLDVEVKVLPTQLQLPKFACKVLDAESITDDVTPSIASLLDLSLRRDVVGYIIPEYLSIIDPSGLLVPEMVSSRIRLLESPSKESIWLWSRFAGHYAFGSASWKKIAMAAVEASKIFSPRDQMSIFVSICPSGVSSSSYPAGEMDPRYQLELSACKKEMDEEAEPALVPFRLWRLEMAQASFDRALAEFHEENEE